MNRLAEAAAVAVESRRDRARLPRGCRRAALVARATLGRLQGRLHAGSVGVGGRSGRAQPALDRGALVRVGRGDPLGDAAAASRASRSSSRPSASGLLANAVLPGRVGELARVAVLNRRLTAGGAARGRRSSAPSSPTASSTSSPSLLLVLFVSDHGEHPRLGVHEPGDRALDRRRALPVRLRQRPALRHDADRGDGLGEARRHHGPPRPRRHAQPGRGRARDPRPVRRLGAPAAGGLVGDAGVRHPRGPDRRRRRAAADERRDDHPALAGQRRARPGRGRDAARPLRRRLRQGRRVRLRAAGDRGVGRCRDRVDLPRPRGAVVRAATRDAGRVTADDEEEDEEASESQPEGASEREPQRARVPG